MKQTTAATGHRNVTRIELWKAIRRVRLRENSGVVAVTGKQSPANPETAISDTGGDADARAAALRKH